MADETEVDVQEVEKEARQLGWLPKEEYKGKEENWVDAPTFVEKGRHILPIVQENNKRLQQQVGMLTARLGTLEGSLKAANTTIKALEDSHAEDVAEQVKAAREGLMAELEAASRDGDHAAVAKLTGKLTELNTANVEAGGEDDERGTGQDQPPVMPAALKAEIDGWFAKNPDYRTGRRSLLAQAVSVELRQKGDTRVGEAFLDAVAAEVEETLGESKGRGANKVEGDAGGGGRKGGGSSGNGKTYADLPAEAKAACDKMAARLVGPERKHKDITSWRKSYVAQYFTDNG